MSTHISLEILDKMIEHRNYLINAFLIEFKDNLDCIKGICEHMKICKSGCYIKLDEKNTIVDLIDLDKDKLIDACIYSTILATFINDIKQFRDMQSNSINQELKTRSTS